MSRPTLNRLLASVAVALYVGVGVMLHLSPARADFGPAQGAASAGLSGPGSSTSGTIPVWDGTGGDALTTSTLSSPAAGTLLAPTALVVGAATTDGVRLEVNTGSLDVREGDDSAAAPFSAGAITGSSLSTFSAGLRQFTDGDWGLISSNGGIQIAADNAIHFSSTNLYTGTKDVGLARSAAGVVKVTDGSSGSGKLLVADGTAAAPAITGSDTDSGVYFGSNIVGICAGGAVRIYTTSSSIDFTGLPIGNFLTSIAANTADANVPTNTSGGLRTNAGASGEVILTLPTAVAGYRHRFVVDAAQFLRVKANTGDVIRGSLAASLDAITTSASAGYWRSNEVGAYLVVESIDATTWQVVGIGGTWTVDS